MSSGTDKIVSSIMSEAQEKADVIIQNANADISEINQKAEKTAREEGFNEIAGLFSMIRKVELKHKKIFNYLYEKLKDKKLFVSDKEKEWICPACGNSVKATVAPEKCPLCLAKREIFTITLPKELATC